MDSAVNGALNHAKQIAARHLAAIALVALVAVNAPAPTAAASGISLPPKLDHNARTVTFEVTLFVYPACSHFYCAVTPQIVAEIATNIDNAWNNDLTFECYELVFNFQIKTGRDWEVGPEEIGIKLDRSPAPVQSAVMTIGNSRWNASGASARLQPLSHGSHWSSPPMNPYTYAHEFGHVLGLDDGYEVVNDIARDRPGAPHDLMSTGVFDSNYISQETVDRLMSRSGVEETDLRCSGWDVDISWTDTYDGALDTIIFDGVVDTVPLTDEFYGISLIGEGTASGSRGGWKNCNPGIDVVPSGTVPATFTAVIDSEAKTIAISAYANLNTALSGIWTGIFFFDLEEEGEQTVEIDPLPPLGELCPHNSYGTATIKPINPDP
jgi:hypothetical protein